MGESQGFEVDQQVAVSAIQYIAGNLTDTQCNAIVTALGQARPGTDRVPVSANEHTLKSLGSGDAPLVMTYRKKRYLSDLGVTVGRYLIGSGRYEVSVVAGGISPFLGPV